MKHKTKGGLFRTMLSSYLILILLMTLLNVVIYLITFKQLEKRISQSHAILLQQTAEAVERLLLEVQTTGKQILATEQVNSLVYSSSALSVYKKICIAELGNELIRRIAHNTNIHEIYVYFSMPRVAASTNGIQYHNGFKKFLTNRLGWSFSYFDSLFSRQKNMFTTSMIKRDSGSGIIAVCVYDASVRRLPYATCILLMDEKCIADMLDISSINPSTRMWVVDEEGYVLSSSGDTCPVPAMSTEESIFYYEDGVQYFAQSILIDGTTWKLVSAIDMTSYRHPMTVLQRTVVIIAGLFIIAGIVMAVYFTKQGTGRIRQIAKRFMSHLEQSGQSRNELLLLEQGMHQLLQENETYRFNVQKHLKEMQQACSVRMLLGKFPDEAAFQEACRDYKISFIGERFIILCMDIVGYIDNVPREDDLNEDRFDLLNYSLDSLTEHFLSQHYYCQFCDYDNLTFCILNLQENARDEKIVRHRIKIICQDMVTSVRESISIQIRCYISSLRVGAAGVAMAYHEARRCMEQIESFNMQSDVMTQEDVLNALSTYAESGLYELSLERLATTFSQNDKKNIWSLFEQALYNSAQGTEEMNFRYLRACALKIVNKITEILLYDEAEEYMRGCQTTMRIMDIDNLAEMRMFVEEYASDLATVLEKERAGSGVSALVSNAVEYIDTHYFDPMITVSVIAEAFHISQSYLLRTFKKVLKMGVLDYIQQRRVEEAKRLLRETKMTVNSIAECVGYTNSLALIRNFKKTENLTPTAYRKIL